MLTDAATKKYLGEFYHGELPTNGIKFTMSLLSRGKFSSEYKARCILKVLYLEDSINYEYITPEGWKAIRCSLEFEDDAVHECIPMNSQK